MKYPRLDLGQIEAIVNKLGGMEGVRRLLAGEVTVSAPEVRISVSPSTPFEYYADWELVSDVEVQAGELTLKLAPFLKKGEASVKGDELTKRAKAMSANFGQRHAEALLRVQAQIPKEWRKYYLPFPGTVRRRPCGYLCVLCLRWRGDHWDLNFSWLGRDFDSNDRLVRACPSTRA